MSFIVIIFAAPCLNALGSEEALPGKYFAPVRALEILSCLAMENANIVNNQYSAIIRQTYFAMISAPCLRHAQILTDGMTQMLASRSQREIAKFGSISRPLQ